MSKWSELLLSPQFVGGAVGTAGNIVSTLLTNASNRAMQREANEFNRQMWLEQTEYNSPSNQIARLKGAGLNPNLANGEPNQAGAPPEYRSSKNEVPQVDPMMIANAMLLKSQQEVNDALALKEQAEAEKVRTEDALLKKDLGTYDDRWNLEKISQDIVNSLNRAKEDITREDLKQMKIKFDEWNSEEFKQYRRDEYYWSIQNSIQDFNLKGEQRNHYRKLAYQVEKQTEELIKKIEILFNPSKYGGKSLFQAEIEQRIDKSFSEQTSIEIQNSIQSVYRDIINSPEYKKLIKDGMITEAELKDDLYYKITQRLEMFFNAFPVSGIDINAAFLGGANIDNSSNDGKGKKRKK